MKILLYLVVPVFVFCATLLGALAATGHLNQQSFEQLMGKKPVAAEAKDEKKEGGQREGLGLVADQLREREAAVAKRELELNQRQAQLDAQEKNIKQQTADLKTLMAQIDGNLAQAEQDRLAKIKTQSLSVESMKPEKAAQALNAMTTQDAAAILAQIKDKSRGKILNSMEQEKATAVIKALQDVKQPSSAGAESPATP